MTGHLADPALAGGEVLALSADGAVERAPIGADGQFEVALAGGRAWVLHFARDGAFGATLWVTGFAGGRSTRLRLPERDGAPAGVSSLHSMLSADDGGAGGDPAADSGGGAGGTADAGAGGANDGAVDSTDDGLALGEVSTDGGIATAENDPGDSLDADGDGIADAADEDADGSGVPDDLEEEDDDVDVAAVGLVVTDVEPRPGAHRVDPYTKVEVRFDLPLDPASVTADTVRLVDEAGASVAVELDHEGTELVLVPAAPLVTGARYAVELGALVAATGETLAAPFRSTFRVESEEEAAAEQETAQVLRVRELAPRHGAEDVALDAVIEVEFNLPLDEATVAQGEGGFALLDPEGVAVPGTLTLERAKRLVFVPGAPLLPSTDYAIAIGTGFEARGPQVMEGAVGFAFRTGTGAATADRPRGGPASHQR